MDLDKISLFVAVAKAPSFSAAASQLGVRRSSVSRGIAALERSLGVRLFSRTTRHVALTTAGGALYARVAAPVAALADALGSLPEREEEPSGQLRLTAPTDLGAVLLPEILAGFSLRYPRVSLDVRAMNRRVDLVAEGFDAALRVAEGPLADSSLVARKLSELELQVFASPTYLARAGVPRTAQETDTHQWVSFRGRPRLPPLRAPRVDAPVIGDDMLFILGAVRAGLGLGVLPSFLARDDVTTGKLVRVLPGRAIPSGVLYLVHPPGRPAPRKVTALRDYLVEHFTVHPLVGRGPDRRRSSALETQDSGRGRIGKEP